MKLLKLSCFRSVGFFLFIFLTESQIGNGQQGMTHNVSSYEHYLKIKLISYDKK